MNILSVIYSFILKLMLVLGYIILPCLAICAFVLIITSFDYIRKHKQLFKHIFKTRKPFPPIKDIAQIFTIVILILFIIFVFFFMGFIYSDCKRPRPLPCGGTECPVAMKHALAVLNQAVSLHKKSGEELSYKNAHEFGEMLAKRIYTIKIYNLGNRNTAVLSNRDIKKYNLEEYKDNPIIATARGTYFMIPKFETGCKKVDIVNPENSDCLIDVDLNGIERKPNKKEGYNPQRPSVNDRYTFIIDGNNNHIILPDIYQNNSRSKNGR